MELKFKAPNGQIAVVPVKHNWDGEDTVELTLTMLRELLREAGFTEMSQRLSEPAV